MPPHPPLKLVHNTLLKWYRKEGRSLPWRKTRNPYRILVSEMMLQQTQVPRVIVKYAEFLRRFPTIRSLASASPGKVLRAWSGLGYNRRALWLHQSSRNVIARHRGRIPDDYESLTSLPGIGPNTARGILCFAFGKRVAVIDVNVSRVLARLFPNGRKHAGSPEADPLLPPRRAYDWNQALMDLGSGYCTASSPACADCPLTLLCPSSGHAERVSKPPRVEPTYRGIPRRIYRGRIVRIVGDSGPLTLRELTRRTIGSSESPDKNWVEGIVRALHKEGLLRVQSHDGGRFVAPVR